ncbi:MAG TPA: hypothetical protein VIJ39_11365 [Solirubrobacteraceae bacterium]
MGEHDGMGDLMGRIGLAAVALATTTLAIAGCGGSSAKPLTRAELTAKANVICKTVTTRFASKSINSQQEMARVIPELAAFEQTALAELSKLVPPAELANDWKKFVAGAETLAENTAKLGEYAKAKNIKAAGSLITGSEAIQQQMRATAKQDGITACEKVT